MIEPLMISGVACFLLGVIAGIGFTQAFYRYAENRRDHTRWLSARHRAEHGDDCCCPIAEWCE